MSWRLGCLVVTALAVWQAHAKPLIEDATFSDVDLVAEDSFANAVYVAAPTRLKRTPQHFGPPGYDNGPPPPPPPAEPSAPQPTSPALPQPTKTPRPPASTQLTIAPVPSTTAAPVLVTMAPTTSTTTTTTTAEPFYDIDVRFGN
nr:proteoglycan 4 [Bactrocera oleae]